MGILTVLAVIFATALGPFLGPIAVLSLLLSLGLWAVMNWLDPIK